MRNECKQRKGEIQALRLGPPAFGGLYDEEDMAKEAEKSWGRETGGSGSRKPSEEVFQEDGMINIFDGADWMRAEK